MKIWDMLRTWLHTAGSAAGVRSPMCGHWSPELIDGLCVECVDKRAKARVFADLFREDHGELPK